MNTFHSKPHKIRAFKFKGRNNVFPKWFMDAYHIGKVFVTITDKAQYIEIIGKRGSQKGFIDEWICINSSGTIFVLSDEELRAGFDA